jgi:hypothetical protein
MTISEDVYSRCDAELSERFTPLGIPFEGKRVYAYVRGIRNKLHFDWFSQVRFHDSHRLNVVPERMSEREKAEIIKHAQVEVVDVGTALRTCSYYLGSTQRPTYYRDQVIRLIESGVDYTCVLLNPDSPLCDSYGKERDEDLRRDVTETLGRLKGFHEEVEGLKGKFRVLLYSRLPYFACIAVDRSNDGIMVLSSYFPCSPSLRINRADTMHVIITREQSRWLYDQVAVSIEDYIRDTRTVVYNFK